MFQKQQHADIHLQPPPAPRQKDLQLALRPSSLRSAGSPKAKVPQNPSPIEDDSLSTPDANTGNAEASGLDEDKLDATPEKEGAAPGELNNMDDACSQEAKGQCNYT